MLDETPTKQKMLKRMLKVSSDLTLGANAAVERNYTMNQIKTDMQISYFDLLFGIGVSIETANKIQKMVDEDLGR
jgi:hypothetical protein